MDKLYHFVLQTDRMLPIWLEEAEYWSKHILTDGLKKYLEDTKDASSIFFTEVSEDKYRNKNNEDCCGGEVSWYINVSNILLCL